MTGQVPRTTVHLGLTGGIGSGKSTVASALKQLGAEVIDADAISRGTTQAGGSAMAAVAAIFGQRYIAPDGALDRQAMRARIFEDPEARTRLEAIVHPLVAEEIATRVNSSTAHCVVFDVPLLVESPRWRHQLDWVWVVDCEEETQITRVQRRSGWERAMVQAVMNSQSPRRDRVAAADVVIFNDTLSLHELHHLVGQLASDFGL